MDPRSVQRLNAESAFLVNDVAFNTAVRKHVSERLNASDAVVDGRLERDNSNPAKLPGGLFGRLKLMKTWPFYMFENQI
jgi:hypothetical protein